MNAAAEATAYNQVAMSAMIVCVPLSFDVNEGRPITKNANP